MAIFLFKVKIEKNIKGLILKKCLELTVIITQEI